MFNKLAFAAHRATSQDELMLLGRTAAKSHLEEGVSLTEAVTKLAKEQNLDRTAVGFVARAANQATWHQRHHADGDREAEFDPADPEAVYAGLGITQAQAEEALYDYMGDPPGEKVALDLDTLFGEPSEDYPLLDPDRERDLWLDKQASVVDTARYAVDRALPVLREAQQEFYEQIKQTYLEQEYPLTKIARVLGEVIMDRRFLHAAMSAAGSRLEQDGVRISMEKEASGLQDEIIVPNPEHPLIKAAAALQEATLCYGSALAAHQRFSAEYAEARSS